MDDLTDFGFVRVNVFFLVHSPTTSHKDYCRDYGNRQQSGHYLLPLLYELSTESTRHQGLIIVR